MHRSPNWLFTFRSLVLLTGFGASAFLAASCGSAPEPFPVFGPGVSGNAPPTLTILEPNMDLTRGQGDSILIRWTASDPDDNAQISFSLINVFTNARILLIEGIDEDRAIGTDSVTISTSLIPIGTYQLLGTITDNVNEPVDVFARTTGVTPRRAEIRIVGPGEGQQTQPPTIAVTQPSFNVSVSQDDILTVVVQPSTLPPAPERPFDPDSDITLFVVLDLDTDPTNDDPANPDMSQIIRLRTSTVSQGAFEPITFNIPIDLNQVPPRPGGAPYFIRVTADDGTNPRVHQYAVGTINVARLASGIVDLFDIGRTLSGARFYGFTPGANLGTTVTGNADFDADGVDDFLLVAQFGNPRNFGTIGEAYLIYGLPGVRFGGSIAVNTVSDTLSGVIFEAPPIRTGVIPSGMETARTDGITSAAFVPDITFDGRPEILFGLRHVHGAFDSTDYDPADEDPTQDTVDVEIQMRRDCAIVNTGDFAFFFDPDYDGVEDTTISSAQPGTNLGASTQLSWMNNQNTNVTEWTLIKFSDVLEVIPDRREAIDITTVSATLELRVFDTGGTGSVRQVFSNFTESSTFATFGAPVEGIHYSEIELGTLVADEAGVAIADVSELVRQLIDGLLEDFDDEIRLIVVPGDDELAEDRTAARSSESSAGNCISVGNLGNQRSLLRIGYTQLNVSGASGCYPDPLVNNLTNIPATILDDVQFFAGGMVALVNSENRDSEPRVSPAPTRLDTTSVALELVGQRAAASRLDRLGRNNAGPIRVRADDQDTTGRIAGARFIAGGYDAVDAGFLRQPPRDDWFGDKVSTIGDLNNDGIGEIIVSAPRNELHLQELDDEFGGFNIISTHIASTVVHGSIVVYPGQNYFLAPRDKDDDTGSTSRVPALTNAFGRCTAPREPRGYLVRSDIFEVFAEHPTDMLGGASSAGDFNQDGLDDILAGAPLNNKNRGTAQELVNAGATYILYGRSILSDYFLPNADDPVLRAPMLRIHGINPNDRVGTVQTRALDVDGDRIDDILIGVPFADRPGVTREFCAGDVNCDGQPAIIDASLAEFNACRGTNPRGATVFCDDECKQYDFNHNGLIDDDDRCVFCCISGECAPAADCTFGLNPANCCANMVDNGFVGIIYGGVFTDGDRDILQIGPDPRAGNVVSLKGTRFWGSTPGHLAGADVASAGDFNGSGNGDILISVPGERFTDPAGRERLGVVYLIFGGPHLVNREFTLSPEIIQSGELPGMVFYSPYVKGRPNEAPPLTVAGIGDINNDGFDDIAIGIPGADFIDLNFPQGPNAPGTDAAVGRRRDTGDTYVVYGSNFGTNRAQP